jgi:hypothetical protein
MAKLPNDDELLKRIGLSEPDLRDFQSKVHEFAKTLNPAQKKSLQKSLPTSKQAAATLGPDVTAGALEKFIRARAPSAASTLVFNNGGSSPKK